MRLTKREAAIATVAYADIFDYPLTTQEFVRWFCFYKTLPKKVPVPVVAGHKRRGREGYIHLVRRQSLIATRRMRSLSSLKKWEKVQSVTLLYKLIPSILLMGVTGAISMNNARDIDDIDILFIVEEGTMWTSRILAVVLTQLLGLRRLPGRTQATDKLCLNMYMTREHLAIPRRERDLFTAHEVLQMVAIWERNGTYRSFLKENSWVKTYLPNAWEERINSQITNLNDQRRKRILLGFIIWVLRFFELPSKVIQLWYMKKRRTTEVVTDSLLRFHPKDARVWVKEELGRRLHRYKIPLDKIFYHR